MMKHAIRAALTAAIAFALTLGAGAQTATQASTAQAATGQPKSGEKTVEEAYLQESAEAAMVKELSHEDGLEAKQLALDYARRGVDAGRKSDDVRSSLQYLALENTEVVVRSGGVGATTNNFPDIRRQACILLGNFPSAESKDTLVRVLRNSKAEDPMVLAEAIRSLGKIGMNDNDEVVQSIADSVSHFDNVGMSEDRLAVYTLFALSDLAEKSHGLKDMDLVTSTVMKFTKGSYIKAVRDLAQQTLDKLSAYQTQNSAKQ
jgi:hypothetical protein